MEMNECAQGVLDDLNRNLARTYASTMASLTESEKAGEFTVDSEAGPFTVHPAEELKVSQRAFLTYRKAMCETAYDAVISGSIRGMTGLFCEIDLTRRHIDQVRWLVWNEPEEG